METIYIIATAFFLIITFLFWRFTNGYFKKEYGEKLWKQWDTRLFFWQGVIYTCAGMTILIMFLLKWVHVLTF